MGMDETRRSKYAEIAVEVLDLDVRRAHDRMVADEVAAKFIAVADAEQQAVASENERLCLEIESLHGRLADSEKTIVDLSGRVARRDTKLDTLRLQNESGRKMIRALTEELMAAGAKVAKVEALADEWEKSGGMLTVIGMAMRLRAALND